MGTMEKSDVDWKNESEPRPIQVSFIKGIRGDGEIVAMSVRQGGDELELTIAQALQLATQITARYGGKRDGKG